jgi:S1-C subfamily serine protease
LAGQVEAQNNDFELSQEFPVSEEIRQEEDNIPFVIENITNSVVGLVSSLTAESATGVNPEFDGSGFVYDKEGRILHIVTAEHVVSGLEDEPFYAYFQDGSRYIAKVIGTSDYLECNQAA